MSDLLKNIDAVLDGNLSQPDSFPEPDTTQESIERLGPVRSDPDPRVESVRVVPGTELSDEEFSKLGDPHSRGSGWVGHLVGSEFMWGQEETVPGQPGESQQ